MSELSHFDEQGASRMVDVADKPVTARMARASALVRMKPETLEHIRKAAIAKGNVFEVARLAGIMATKRTGELIPLCHPLGIDGVVVSFQYPDNASLRVVVEVRTTARTGVEMEAMVGASVAALTIYDMCKSIDKGMEIGPVRLEEKLGGRSGHYAREEPAS